MQIAYSNLREIESGHRRRWTHRKYCLPQYNCLEDAVDAYLDWTTATASTRYCNHLFAPKMLSKFVGQAGTGCTFLYPIIEECPTQPLVTIRNIVLENVQFTDSFLIPGVILADSKNPFSDFHFRNVTNDGLFIVKKDYVCQNVVNSDQSGNSPPFTCF